MIAAQNCDLSAVLAKVSSRRAARSVQERARREALDLIERDGLIRPETACRVLEVRAALGEQLHFGEFALKVPALTEGPGEILAVAAAACTLGPLLETKVSELFQARRALLAMTLDEVGNELLFGLADRVRSRIRRKARRRGLELGAEANPGDPGFALEEQASVLALADARSRGIGLSASGSMQPSKSISFLIALGRGLTERHPAGRCELCPSKERCLSRAR